MIRLSLILILISTFVFGQSKDAKRRENLSKNIIGTWEFRPGEFRMVTKDKRKIDAAIDTWSVKVVTFNRNGEFIYFTRDSTKQSGKWNLSNDGKILIVTDLPKESEELNRVELPIKYKKGVLYITFTQTWPVLVFFTNTFRVT